MIEQKVKRLDFFSVVLNRNPPRLGYRPAIIRVIRCWLPCFTASPQWPRHRHTYNCTHTYTHIHIERQTTHQSSLHGRCSSRVLWLCLCRLMCVLSVSAGCSTVSGAVSRVTLFSLGRLYRPRPVSSENQHLFGTQPHADSSIKSERDETDQSCCWTGGEPSRRRQLYDASLNLLTRPFRKHTTRRSSQTDGQIGRLSVGHVSVRRTQRVEEAQKKLLAKWPFYFRRLLVTSTWSGPVHIQFH